MKLNQFLSLMASIEEVMENDDVDIVVVGKDGGGGRIGKSDLKFNHISDIQFQYCILIDRYSWIWAFSKTENIE